MTKEEANLEFSKILSKIMQSSYKRKEVATRIESIMEKMKYKEPNNTGDICTLRLELEKIRRDFYGL